MRFKVFLPAVLWLITSTILLALPQNNLPHIRFLNFPYSDKLEHIAVFGLLSFLFCYPFLSGGYNISVIKTKFIYTAITIIAYGILMELLQKYFVPGRSFDLLDIVADAAGSFAGASMMLIYFKKIGPDGNRGRNQN